MTGEVSSPIAGKWEGDYLNRVEVAKFLTTYLNSIYAEDDPDLSAGHFVLNLNATWGHGKTFLLTKWAEDLTQNRYPVVMFDAWENDFSKDPLVGFISELYASLEPWLKHVVPAQTAMKNVMKSAKKIIGAGVGVFAGAAAAGLAEAGMDLLGGSLDVSDKKTERLGDSVSENAGKLAERALREHKDTKKAITEFKRHLGTLIKAIEDSKDGINLPLYIFIDELDRCRPTYAIELLENIKHLFGVKGVVFVVATNKEQLCHSIKAVYGDSFDASGYLGRFFDQEYTLPEPDNKRYSRYLLDRYKITKDERLFSPLENKSNSKDHITDLFSLYADGFKLPLRDQGQIVRRLKAILIAYKNPIIYFDYLVFLLMLHKTTESGFKKALDLDQHHGSGDLNRILKSHFDGRKTIEIITREYGGVSRSKIDTTLLELISSYISQVHQSKDQIIETISNMRGISRLQSTILNEATAMKSEYLSISQYPGLVKQVGHLES